MADNLRLSVLYVVHGIPPSEVGGSEIYNLDLAKGLISYGIKSAIFSHCHDKRDGILKKSVNNIQCYIAAGNDKRNNPVFSIKNQRMEELFDAVIKEQSPDIIHFNHLKGFPAYLIEVARANNIPTCLTLHDFWFFCEMTHLFNYHSSILCDKIALPSLCSNCFKDIYFKGIKLAENDTKDIVNFIKGKRAYYIRLLREVDLLVSPSCYLKNTISVFDEEIGQKIKVINTGISVKYLAQGKKRSEKGISFAFFGNVTPVKGVDILLDAFLSSFSRQKDVTLSIFGGYNNSFGTRLYNKYKKERNILFKGAYKREDLNTLLNNIDAVIIPSITENYPLAVLEALSFGVPVIASNVGGIKEIIKENRNGILIKADQYSLGKILNRIYKNRQTLEELRGFRLPVREQEAFYQDYILEYKKLIKNKNFKTYYPPPKADLSFITPFIHNNYLENGKYNYHIRNFRLAEEYFGYLYSGNREHLEINYYLGMISYKKGEWLKAIAYLKTLENIEEQPDINIEEFIYTIAVCYINTKKEKEAIKYLDQLVERYPKNVMANYTLSSLKKDAGKDNEAIAGFLYTLKLLEGNTNFNGDILEIKGKSLFQIGLIEYKTGNIVRAKKYFNKCLLSYPSHISAKKFLARC